MPDELSVTVPMTVFTSLNVTVPVGATLDVQVTLAVNVTLCPWSTGFADELKVVVVEYAPLPPKLTVSVLLVLL